MSCNILALTSRGGAVASLLVDSRSSGLGSSPGRGHCVVFLGKTLDSHSASLHPGVQIIRGDISPRLFSFIHSFTDDFKFNAGGTGPAMASIPSSGE